MSITRILFFSLLVLTLSVTTSAQDLLITKWQPQVAATKKFNSRWKANLMARATMDLFAVGQEDSIQTSGLERADIRLMASRTFFDQSTLTYGYLFRHYTEDVRNYEHRLILQYVIISRYEGWNLGHRFLAEERLFENDYEGRLRYRINTELPLNGKSINARELYLLLSEELVYTYQNNRSDLENRIMAGLGWEMKNDRRIELRLQHRFEGRGFPQSLFLMTNYYFKL